VNTLLDLYDDYRERRKVGLSFEQFIPFVKFYPILLVVHTDGRVDTKEWRYLEHLAGQLSELFRHQYSDAEEVEELRRMYLSEFRYLLQHFDTWERRFIKTLRLYLTEHAGEKQFIVQSMLRSAAVSEGICEKEEIMIEYLKRELDIEESIH
jgi:hypothetical protein